MHVAQLVEHWSPKPEVGGSIPSGYATKPGLPQQEGLKQTMNELAPVSKDFDGDPASRPGRAGAVLA